MSMNTSTSTSILIGFVVSFLSKTICVSSPTEIVSYEIRLQYWGTTEIFVQATATIDRDVSKTALCFLFDSNARINSVSLVGNDSAATPYARDGDTLRLPDTVERKGQLCVLFDYSLPMDSLNNGVATLFRWYPYLLDNLAKYKLTASTTKDYMIISSGALSTGGGDYVWEVQTPVPRIVLVIAKSDAYTVITRTSTRKEATFYFLNGDTAFIRDTSVQRRFIGESLDAFGFCNEVIGPYNYDALAFVEIPDLQYVDSEPTLILMGSSFLNIYRKNQYDWPAHELAHQWFGSGVFGKHSDLKRWCFFEPLAEYLRLMFTGENRKESVDRKIEAIVAEYKSDYLGKE